MNAVITRIGLISLSPGGDYPPPNPHRVLHLNPHGVITLTLTHKV